MLFDSIEERASWQLGRGQLLVRGLRIVGGEFMTVATTEAMNYIVERS